MKNKKRFLSQNYQETKYYYLISDEVYSTVAEIYNDCSSEDEHLKIT